ncbi:MAG: efflux RND transporter permease subunit [Flavobacteriales bacterium]|nr:efflux RND transporter permease subunit [Flavobacteriales bacterium]
MLNAIIRYALHNRPVVLALATLLLVWGGITAGRMDVDVFPDLTAPTVVVMTESHGMASEEVERLVTFPIESAVNGAAGVRRVRSSSATGFSLIWVEFEWGTPILQARQTVTEKLGTVTGLLPGGVSEPILAPQASIMGEIMLVALTMDSSATGTEKERMDLRTLAEWQLRPRLQSVAGVANVMVIGGLNKQYQVLADPLRMQRYDVTLEQLVKACESSNANAAGSYLVQNGQEYIVRGMARTDDVEELGNVVIADHEQEPVRIADVAEVRLGSSDRIGDAALDTKPAVVLTISKQPSTNTLELTERLDRTLEQLRAGLPDGVRLHTHIFRQSDFIEASINNVQRSLVEGSIFVVVVLLVFLMNIRSTIISLLAIPLSLLVSILALEWLGFTINTMSLGGMAIAIGALVDDAIIDVDNVLKRLRENVKLPADQRRPALTVIYDASTEIRASILNATLIIIAAFVPLFFLSGMEGRMLTPLGVSFIVALFASLVVAITVTPVLCSLLLTNEQQLQRQSEGSWLVRKLKAWYARALERMMGLRRAMLIGTVALFVASMALFATLGRSFLPEFNEGSLVISAVSLPGIPIDQSNAIGERVERELLTISEVQGVTRRTGRAERDEHAQGSNASELEVPFILADRDREEFMADVREKLAGVSGVNITIGQPIAHRLDHMLSGTRANIAIKLFGPDLGDLFAQANRIKGAIEGTPGLVDLSVEQQVDIPQVRIDARRGMLARYGITTGAFTDFVDVAIAGEKVGEVFEGERRFDLVLRYKPEARNSIDALRDVPIDARNGAVPLSAVADVRSVSGPSTINRENVQRRIVISANVAGRDLRGVVEEIQQRIGDKVQLQPGYHIEYGGQFESEAAASRILLIASLIALGVIFLLLYQEFQEAKLAGIILINLPLALIGGVVAVWLSGGTLSIPAIIGFITLFGVATRNGILLVSHYGQLEAEGETVEKAVIHGSVDRLTPILMTALTAALALIPLALASDDPGNEIQSPMAKVILGGLLSSTFLNMFIIPAVYRMVKGRSTQR